MNPCLPSPCGSNADCRVQENHPICTCISGMFGAPPNCRPECMIDQDCISSLACIQKKCLDPCVGSCGFNTNCTVQNHRPICQCYEGYEGDPFSGCAKGKSFQTFLKRILDLLCNLHNLNISSLYSRFPSAIAMRSFAVRCKRRM